MEPSLHMYTTDISIIKGILQSLSYCKNNGIAYFRSARLEVELSWFTLTSLKNYFSSEMSHKTV